MLCFPLSQLTVSSTTRVLPSRELLVDVGYFVVPAVGNCHDNCCVSGSVVAVSVPCAIDARSAASVFAISGLIVDVYPLLAASAIRLIVPPEYWNIPCSESGLMTVGVSVRVLGELIHS